jgi:phosphoglycolate phosphatase-like HAD superfamily hydrolase
LPRPVRGVLLDMCGVLYDNTVWRRWLLRLLTKLGLHTSYHAFFRVLDRDFLAEVHCGKQRFDEAFRAFLRSAGLSRGQIDEVEAACQARRRQWEASARTLPGVKNTLGRLAKSGFALGGIINSEYPADVLRERLTRFGLEPAFVVVVSSIDLGQTMPDPLCYRTALAGMGLPPADVAFVGHDTAQLAGAAAIGMATIAFNFDPDAQADAYLGRFEELLEVVSAQPPLAAAG